MQLSEYLQDTVLLMNEAIISEKKILVEGANAAMLDIDFGVLSVEN